MSSCVVSCVMVWLTLCVYCFVCVTMYVTVSLVTYCVMLCSVSVLVRVVRVFM